MSRRVYTHFLTLTVAVSFLLDANEEKRNHYLEYARQLLKHFVDECPEIYGKTFCVYNIHNLLHLSDDVEHFNSSLNDISCFPYENFLQSIKTDVKNRSNPIDQVIKRLKVN